MGLAGQMASWQRQTLRFGHDRGDEFSVLVLDNRGIGQSDKPLWRYSTSEMARDVIEVLDHVGWTAEREVNLMGISLGGMIAQEVACAIPSRLQSLSLLCTTASLSSPNKPLLAKLREALSMVIPKTDELAVADTARSIFPEAWLASPDAEVLPVPGMTPACGPAPGSPDGRYGLFGSNFQRFQAQELTKRRNRVAFTRGGFFCQLLAAAGHHKSGEQLVAMADRVGRERIWIVHGTEDKIIHPSNGRRLIECIEPGEGMVVEGLGHAPIMQMTSWFHRVMEERLAAWTKLECA